jgi:predicted RNase H-like HicB family nuclease
MTDRIHVAVLVTPDEDGVWCAKGVIRAGVAAFGNGPTREAAIDDLRAGLALLVDTLGMPGEVELDIM